uniref:Uncharacterized protein n=1 Tax=Ditylenchus dipsaci TaxID=166011 RepID=A0A915DEM2_9BILA
MYTTTNNNNNNYYFNNNNINPNFYKTEENTYHKRNYSTSSSNENRRFDSNRNKETAESNTYPSNRQNNNYNNHYSNTRNYPNNHSSAGFSDNSNTKPYRHRNSNYQQDRFQPVNNGCGDYNSAAPVKQPVLQPLTQQNINKPSESRNQGQAWKPAQYSRQSSHSSYKGYSRQNSDANTNTNWRKASTTRASLDNDNTDSKAIKHNSSGKPIGVAKPLSSTVRVTGTNTAGLQSLIRSSDKMSDSEQYRPSDKKSEDIRSFYPNNSKQDKSTQPNEHDPKKRIECLEEQEYNFVEVEFPSLVEGVDENSKKSSSCRNTRSFRHAHKQVNNPVIASEHKVQFSAIVAGIKMPKQQSVSTVFPPDDVGLCASGASKCSYAQTLKKHASK